MARVQSLACQLCSSEVDSRYIEKHYVVPKEVMEQARIRRARIVRLCPECNAELRNWYETKIAATTYDTQINKFRQKLPAEMVKEYEGLYNRFARYKKSQRV